MERERRQLGRRGARRWTAKGGEVDDEWTRMSATAVGKEERERIGRRARESSGRQQKKMDNLSLAWALQN